MSAAPAIASPAQEKADGAHTRDRLLVLVPVFAAAVVFLPITWNYFREDDFVNFYFIENYGLKRFLITVWAEHALITRNAIWWLLHAVVGTRPEPYFVLAYLTHLAGVAVLFEALRRLTTSATAACVAALLWGAAPVHQEAIGWFSVYGQVLAVVIVAYLLVVLAKVRDGASFGAAAACRAAALMLVVATCFGVGLGVALGFPAVAFALLPPSRTRTRVVVVFGAIGLACFAAYQGLIRLVWSLYGPFPHMPLSASLAVPGALFRLFGALIGNGIVALSAGPFASRIEEFGIGWWAIVVAWVALAVAVFVRAPTSQRRVMLAGLALAFACYGALAGGRAPYFAGGIAFDREARYQYAATLGLAVVVAVVVEQLAARLGKVRVPQVTGLGVFAASLVASVLLFAPGIEHHDAERSETAQVIAAIRREIEKAPPGKDVYIPNQRFASVGLLISTAGFSVFPGWAAVFAVFFPDDTVNGRRVHFLTDPAIVQAGRPGLRSAGLLVPSSSPPATPAVRVAPECADVVRSLASPQARLHCPDDAQDFGLGLCRLALNHAPSCSAELRAATACLEAATDAAWRCDEKGRLSPPQDVCVPEVNALSSCVQ